MLQLIQLKSHLSEHKRAKPFPRSWRRLQFALYTSGRDTFCSQNRQMHIEHRSLPLSSSFPAEPFWHLLLIPVGPGHTRSRINKPEKFSSKQTALRPPLCRAEFKLFTLLSGMHDSRKRRIDLSKQRRSRAVAPSVTGIIIRERASFRRSAPLIKVVMAARPLAQIPAACN